MNEVNKFNELPMSIGDELQTTVFKLSSEDAGLLFKCISFLWSNGKSQSSIPCNSAAFNEFLKSQNIGEKQLEILSNCIAQYSSSLLLFGMEIDDNGFYRTFRSDYLLSIYNRMENDRLELELQTKRSLKLMQNKNKTVKQLVSSTDMSRLFLLPEERDLSKFNGWFPLHSFNNDGAAFNMRKDHIKYLNDTFSKYSVNVEETLNEIFTYLVSHQHKRKPYGFMNNFINNWFRSKIRSVEDNHCEANIEKSSTEDFLAQLEKTANSGGVNAS